MHSNAANPYLEQQVATASPARLTGMLFDALVGAALRGADLLEAGERVAARRPLLRAQEIVLELRTSLRSDLGGELARNLDRLYEFVYGQLVRASADSDARSAQAAARIAGSLRDSWYEACLVPAEVAS